jgi:hypothetical protein
LRGSCGRKAAPRIPKEQGDEKSQPPRFTGNPHAKFLVLVVTSAACALETARLASLNERDN